MSSKKTKYKSIIRDSVKGTTKERIWAYYLDSENVILTEKEEEIRKRWSACFSMLTQYHSIQQAVHVMQQQFDISEAQAYRDARSAIELFGDVTKSEKEAYRHILFEYAMKIFQLAASKNDMAEMNKALASMIKIKGLNKEDSDIPDFANMMPHTYEIVLPAEHLKLLQDMSRTGVINIEADEY